MSGVAAACLSEPCCDTANGRRYEVTSAAMPATAPASTEAKEADVFVVFGITGRPGQGDDVPLAVPARAARAARVPDRRRRRRRLDDRPARRSAPATRSSAPASSSTRPCSRASRSGSRTCRATSATPPRTSASRPRSPAPRAPVFYLEIPPFLFGRVVQGLAEAGLTKNARIVVEKPFGHDRRVRPRARRRAPPVHRRVAALPHRPLPREDGPRGDPLPPVREHDARAGLEPEHVACVEITMAEDFGVEDRGHFYDPVGALRDVVVNHLMQVVAATAMEPPVARRHRDDQGRAGRAVPRGRRRRTRRTTSAGSTTATSGSTASPPTRRPRRTRRSGSRSRTGAGRACRSSSAPASACP